MSVQNYLTAENGAKVLSSSSEERGCYAENVLCSMERKLWLSERNLPQEITLDISNLTERPKEFGEFGWYCWHFYNSNPSQVDLYAAQELNSWKKWGSFHAESQSGCQVFKITPLDQTVNYLKVVVNECFGANRTYMNQVFLYQQLEDKLETQLVDLNQDLKNLTGSPFKLAEHSLEYTPSPAYRKTPSNQEIQNLKQEVSNWTQDIEELKETLGLLTQQVNSLTQFVQSKNQVEQEQSEFTAMFNQHIKHWEETVLTPKLETFFEKVLYKVDNKTQEPSNILEQLQKKMQERELKLQRLNGRKKHTEETRCKRL